MTIYLNHLQLNPFDKMVSPLSVSVERDLISLAPLHLISTSRFSFYAHFTTMFLNSLRRVYYSAHFTKSKDKRKIMRKMHHKNTEINGRNKNMISLKNMQKLTRNKINQSDCDEVQLYWEQANGRSTSRNAFNFQTDLL